MKKCLFAVMSIMFLLCISTSQARAAETGYSKIVSIKNKTGLTCKIRLQTDKVRTYQIFKQSGRPNDTVFLRDHGCSTCALTTILNSVGGYKYGPAYVHKKVIPQTLGRKYTMPIKLYGIHKVLKKYRIRSTFVPRFTKARAKRDLTTWLKKGGVVIVTVRAGSDHRWTRRHHSFLLLGLKKNGKVIIGDSAMENYQGDRRIKTAYMNDIVRYMLPCTSSRYTYCWPGTNTAGGYILTGDVE